MRSSSHLAEGSPQLWGTTIDQAIALLEASEEVAFTAGWLPAATPATSAVKVARLPPPLPAPVVRRVRPAGVVHVRAVLAFSDQYLNTADSLVATFTAGAGCAATGALPRAALGRTVAGAGAEEGRTCQ